MIRTLTTLRDFMDQESLKFLPGNLKAGTFMLLMQNKINSKEEKDQTFKRVIQVFDETGTWIGEISNPDFIPSSK